MNTRQKLYQAQLQEWAIRFADQKVSRLTVRQWCKQNNLSFHTYNYWKHLLKEEALDQTLTDIVPLSLPVLSGSNSSSEATIWRWIIHPSGRSLFKCFLDFFIFNILHKLYYPMFLLILQSYAEQRSQAPASAYGMVLGDGHCLIRRAWSSECNIIKSFVHKKEPISFPK